VLEQLGRAMSAIGDAVIQIGSGEFKDFDSKEIIIPATSPINIRELLTNFSEHNIKEQALLNFGIVIPDSLSKSEMFDFYITIQKNTKQHERNT
jgi:hypothetical protein